MMIIAAVSTCAFGQAAGTTEQAWVASSTKSAANVSLTRANGDLWFAFDFVDPTGDPDDPGLELLYWNLPLPGSQAAKTLQSIGALDEDGIFASSLTWGGADNVLVTGKLDPTGWGTQPHLRIYTQDRDDLTQAATVVSVTPEGDYEHALPHLTRDGTLPAQHLCWTDQTGGGPTGDNVRTKVKDDTTWLGSTLRAVSIVSGEEEDHCQVDFTYSGRRYSVYHHDTPDTPTVQPDIFLEITTWDGTTWTEVADFGLTDSDGVDFPSLWVQNTATTTEVGVVAFNPDTDNIAYWNCGPATESSCDQASDFGSPQATSNTGDWNYPEVFILPRGSTTDTFVLVERDVINTDTVHLLSLCGGTGTTFTDEGPLPLATGFDDDDEQFLGARQAWSRSQVRWDGTEFDVSFLSEKDSTFLHVMRYHAAPGDFCPP